ncbi:hypothetical protein VSDG_04030 [Cytospora chrysosperma]|uniref:Uncharacterized protein n=1 Tax=Cytospora chrysosperma TaxID=252740 RepID=A0A423W7C9_CYTCH|nr:hypothetical protein VSDG_04030 [Valsa sordida]
MPSVSGNIGFPPPIQAPPPRVSSRPSPLTTAILQQDSRQPATGHRAPRQASSSGTHETSPPRPASPGLFSSAQSPSASSDSASSAGWTPGLQLAKESSSQLQTALGLVNVATANSHSGNRTAAASSQHGQLLQQKGGHAVAGPGRQQSQGSVDPRPWFF